MISHDDGCWLYVGAPSRQGGPTSRPHCFSILNCSTAHRHAHPDEVVARAFRGGACEVHRTVLTAVNASVKEMEMQKKKAVC